MPNYALSEPDRPAVANDALSEPDRPAVADVARPEESRGDEHCYATHSTPEIGAGG